MPASPRAAVLAAVAALPAHASTPSAADPLLHRAATASGASAPDLSTQFGALARGSPGADAPLSTLDTGFESLQPFPASLFNQLDVVTWGGAAAGLTARSRFTGTPFAFCNAVTDTIGGNATMKLRGFVASPGMGPNAFFGLWARYNTLRTNTASPTQEGAERFVFAADLAQDVRVSHDTFLNSIASQWTSEPTCITNNLITARLVWGGTGGINGLPVEVTDFYSLLFDCPECPTFVPCAIPRFYRSGLPFPGWNGADPISDPTQRAHVPVAAWFTIIHEFPASGLTRHVLDLHDGHGEFVIYERPGNVGPGPERVDSVGFHGNFETELNAIYIDNLHIQGVRFATCLRPQGDLDFDGDVDFADLNLILSQYGQTAPPGGSLAGDVNSDGAVDFIDLNILLSNYGATC